MLTSAARDEPLAEVADAVRDLTQPQRHAEAYQPQDEHGRPVGPRRHFTRHPSLLQQLRAASTAGRGDTDDIGSGGYESRPAARIEALDRLAAIEDAADDWLVRGLGISSDRGSLEANLRALVGQAGHLDRDNQHRLAHDVRRWLTWARVVTGWDSPPWRPNATCPMCESTTGLRVRLSEYNAVCLDCGDTWDPTNIGLLADHLRELDADTRTLRQQHARLRAALDGYFPHRGPCLVCGIPGEDARHRVIDDVVSRVLAGDPADQVADDHGLPVDAVRTAVALATWPAPTDPQQEARSA